MWMHLVDSIFYWSLAKLNDEKVEMQKAHIVPVSFFFTYVISEEKNSLQKYVGNFFCIQRSIEFLKFQVASVIWSYYGVKIMIWKC